MEINRFASKDEATAAAGERLHNLLIVHKDGPVLLLLSGGSALAMLDYVSKVGTGEHLTIGMLDERFSLDSSANNFSQFQKTDFYTFALEMETNFFGTLPRPGETKEMLAERMEKRLRAWKEENPNGRIFATLGLGADGHTAGIFPADEKRFSELFESETWVMAYNAGELAQYPDRVTSTITFFQLLDEGIAFVSGQEKADKLSAVINSVAPINELPARAWEKIKNVRVFTDINM
jgi:6-phosphogluconolactonase/glucosamine-6-phosphate isomerase/deaminase